MRAASRARRSALLFGAWLNDSIPGEQTGQLEALLERWQTSLDLHARYAALDDARYWHVQPWPKHERPQRWIIQLARKRILALKRIVAQRQSEGDRAFIEGIEIMGFLATMVGLTSVERFIPLATHETESRDVLSAKPDAANAIACARGGRARPGRTAAPHARARRAPANTKRTAETTRQMPALPQLPGASAKREPARPASRQAPAGQRAATPHAPPPSNQRKAPTTVTADRARGDRRRRALVRLGQAVARARGHDRAARPSGPAPRKSAASCAPTATRSTPSPPADAIDYNGVICRRVPPRLARRRAPQQNPRPGSHGTILRARPL